MDYKYYIENNFGVKINNLTLLDSHFGTDIFLAETENGKFIVKKLPIYMSNVKNEGRVTDFLRQSGIKVPYFLKLGNGDCNLIVDDAQITVQEFIEGRTLSLNEATDVFLKTQIELLGKINNALIKFEDLPLRFDKNFFTKRNAKNKLKAYKKELKKVKSTNDFNVISKYEEQIKHLKKVASFKIDTSKLTYTNSHGDYNIRQIVIDNDELAVVDWSSACKLPICLEIASSYAFASPKCADGSIDSNELIEYIRTYTKHFKLSKYDLECLPYVFYFWHTMCNYHPNEKIANNYMSLANLIYNLQNWLYDNVDSLSETLKNADLC